jgi:haloalkane dehalogenase
MSISQPALLLEHPTAGLSEPRPAWLPRALFPFESRFLSVTGTRFHYIDEGQGPPLLFLHGGPMSSFMWRHQLTHLRQNFRCIAADIPGLGLSRTELVRGHGFERMADALQAFVRALDLWDFTLVVHATGGPSGLEMAIRERERLRNLVISNTFAWPLFSMPKLRPILRIVSSRLFSFLVDRFNLLGRIAARRGRRYGDFSPDEREAVLGPYRERITRRHLANLLYGLRAETAFFSRLEARLPSLSTLPALLLFGEEDNGYKAGFLERFARILPVHRARVLERAAHFLTEDAPTEYTRLLEEWLVEQR